MLIEANNYVLYSMNELLINKKNVTLIIILMFYLIQEKIM